MLGWVRRRRQLWKGGGSAQQAGCWPLWGHLPWGTGEDGGWVPALSMHFLSFLPAQAEVGRRYP